MTTNNQPTIIVIVGISGDLSRRKLLPAISKIAEAKSLPDKYKIIGITRKINHPISELLIKTKNSDIIKDNIELFEMDLTETDGYLKLTKHLSDIEVEFGEPAQRLFYLSVPPQISRPIIEQLGVSGLAKIPDTKLLLEKPFGIDLASAKELTEEINLYFKPNQVYRIDHYLAKETAQNIVVFRQDNSLFKQTWNKDFIEKIEIVAQESIGIEGRNVFYEQTGALRDLIQSHLLQLAALVLMDLPDDRSLVDIPNRRLEALQALRLPVGEPIEANVIRGQYLGYQEEVNNNGSTVETFVSLKLESVDPKWLGVPITLTTGKALDEKFIGVKISYKKDKSYEANQLVLRLQPNEGVDLCLWSKKPGYDYQVDKHPLKFNFGEHYQSFPEAYEQVLFNAINSDHSLFASSEEVLESWRIIDVIQKSWEMNGDDLVNYRTGDTAASILNQPEELFCGESCN
jgi:glucose-6-phosphate 1-dehydrogenase